MAHKTWTTSATPIEILAAILQGVQNGPTLPEPAGPLEAARAVTQVAQEMGLKIELIPLEATFAGRSRDDQLVTLTQRVADVEKRITGGQDMLARTIVAESLEQVFEGINNLDAAVRELEQRPQATSATVAEHAGQLQQIRSILDQVVGPDGSALMAKFGHVYDHIAVKLGDLTTKLDAEWTVTRSAHHALARRLDGMDNAFKALSAIHAERTSKLEAELASVRAQGLGAQVTELTKLVNRLGERVDTAQSDIQDQSSQLVETERRLVEHANGLHGSIVKLTAEVGRAHSRLDKYMRGQPDDRPTD